MTSLIESLKDFPYLGETLALTSAFIWAAAVILFRISGRKVNPLGLNFFKGIVSILFFAGMILIINQPVLFKAPWQSYILLALSGIIGIGISETLFFASLNRLGASLSAVVSCTYSPFVIVLSVAFIQEQMTLLQFVRRSSNYFSSTDNLPKKTRKPYTQKRPHFRHHHGNSLHAHTCSRNSNNETYPE